MFVELNTFQLKLSFYNIMQLSIKHKLNTDDFFLNKLPFKIKTCI